MTPAVIGWKSVLYQSTKHRTEQKLSCRLQICPTISRLFSSFLPFIESEISEQASRQVATET